MTKVSHANILQNFHFHRQVKRTEAAASAAANKTLHSVYISNSPIARPSASFDFYLFSKLHSNPGCSSPPPPCCVRGSQLGRQKFPRLSNVGGTKHLSQKLLILLAIVSEVIQGGGEGGSEGDDSCSIFK